MKLTHTLLLVTAAALCWDSPLKAAAATPVELAHEGRALLPVSVPENATPELEALARELAAQLARITGGQFEVRKGDAEPAIRLGLRSDFPELLSELQPPQWAGEEGRYRLLTRNGVLWIVGETPLAVQNGVYGFLRELGYRQYFPTPTWEIVPKKPTLAGAWDKVESPTFGVRKLYRPAPTPFHQEALEDWEKKNRMVSNLRLTTVGLLRPGSKLWRTNRNDWFTQNGSKPYPEKEGFMETLVSDALERVTKYPDLDTVGLSPTDGGGWAEESPLGTPSDRMAAMANAITRSFREAGVTKRVAFLAYHEQAPAPSGMLESGPIVLVATSYIRGGAHTPVSLLHDWHERGADVGVYEYLDIPRFSWNLPGRSMGANLTRVEKETRAYADAGARYWVGEASGGWGPAGIGYYLLAQLLWDSHTFPTAEETLNEFITLCFPGVEAEARTFYELTRGERQPLLSEDLFARMYGALEAALARKPEQPVRARLLQLVAWSRFSELVFRYRQTGGNEKKALANEAREFVFACRDFPMFEYRILRQFTEIDISELKPLRKGTEELPRITEEALLAALADGVSNNQRFTFEPRTWSRKLVPFPMGEPVSDPEKGISTSRKARFYWMADTPGASVTLRINSGWREVGQKLPVKVEIEPVDNPLADGGEEGGVADGGEVPCDKEWHEITLRAKEAGLHYLTVDDHFNRTRISWPAGTRITFPSGMEEHPFYRDVYEGVFLVPAGVTRIAGYSENRSGALLGDTGNVIFQFNALPGAGYFDVPVAPSDKPRLFQLVGAKGEKLFMTVPPYFARSGEELLVPQEALSTP